MNNTDLQNISDVIAGKRAINVDASIPTTNIIMLAVFIFLSVLLAVLLANNLSK